MAETGELLSQNLEAFTGFAHARLGDAQLAQDAVQESLLKAMNAGHQPPAAELTRWFYRILRRTIIDFHRRRGARERALARYQAGLEPSAEPDEERVLCGCFQRLLPALPPQYGTLLQRIDLEGASASALAAERGVSANALTVQLHRARRRLRELLEATCRACATHGGCLNCSCGSEPGN